MNESSYIWILPIIKNGDYMIKKFSCHNFRNININDLEFKRINLLIGPNNSGKSNFIKALTFFSEMVKNADEGNLKSAFLNTVARNGWEHLLNKNAMPQEPVEFSWEVNLGDTPVRYNLVFETGNTVEQCNIILEELNAVTIPGRYDEEFNYFRCHDERIGKGHFSTAIQKGKRNHRLTFDVDCKDTLMMQFKDILLENTKLYGSELIRVNIAQLLYEMRKYFERFSVYASSEFNIKEIRKPVSLKNTDNYLNREASNYVNVFNYYKSQNIFWKDMFERKLKELIPDLQTVDTVSVYDKLIFKLAYHNEQYDLSDVSEGTLKGMILNMLINMPMQEKCSLFAVDEPETSLHPAWQKVVGNWIQTADTFQQCFISTHSPDFLDAFTDGFKQGNVAVFVFDHGQEESIRKIVYEDIADELGEWELGDLYRTNDPALGGWPW